MCYVWFTNYIRAVNWIGSEESFYKVDLMRNERKKDNLSINIYEFKSHNGMCKMVKTLEKTYFFFFFPFPKHYNKNASISLFFLTLKNWFQINQLIYLSFFCANVEYAVSSTTDSYIDTIKVYPSWFFV